MTGCGGSGVKVDPGTLRLVNREIPAQLARGFAMGAADIVPGVSGGTVALVLGIYTRLISNVKTGASALGSLVKGDLDGVRARFSEVDWGFLIPLGVGVLAAVGLLSSVLHTLLEDRPVEMAGLFFGLIVASVVLAWRLLKAPTGAHAAVVVAVGALAFVILGLRESTAKPEEALIESSTALPYFFGAGALAICAMILPGVSGSFILLLLSMYEPLLAAVDERDVLPLLVFAAGAVVGLAVFSSLLDRLLTEHHDWVLAALVGLMLGSLRVLWPWPGGIDTTSLSAPSDPVVVPVALGVVAAVIVLVVGFLAPTDETAA